MRTEDIQHNIRCLAASGRTNNMQTLRTITFLFHKEIHTSSVLHLKVGVNPLDPDEWIQSIYTCQRIYTVKEQAEFPLSDGSLYESMYDTQTTPLNHSDATADLRVSSRLDSGHRVTRTAFERMTRIVIELGNFLQDSGFTTY